MIEIENNIFYLSYTKILKCYCNSYGMKLPEYLCFILDKNSFRFIFKILLKIKCLKIIKKKKNGIHFLSHDQIYFYSYFDCTLQLSYVICVFFVRLKFHMLLTFIIKLPLIRKL